MEKRPLLKVRVTSIEKFRRYLNEESDFDTEQSLMETLSGDFTGNDKTRTGSAFHAIIEKPRETKSVMYDGRYYTVASPGENEEPIMFPHEVAEFALKFRRQRPAMFCEVPLGKVYQLPRYNIKVFGKMDGIEGVIGSDTKCVFRNKEVAEYMESCQWKFYSDMVPGLRQFNYHLFEFKGFKDLTQVKPHGILLDKITVEEHEPIKLFPYPSMHSDLLTLLTQFMDYIEYRNFFSYLQKPVPYEADVL